MSACSTSGVGRFVGERNFDAIPMPTWKDFAPRFGVVYDLFGNAKTALKFSVNRYNESRTTQFADRYNPLALTQANLSWTDLNSNDIAEGAGRLHLPDAPAARSTTRRLPANFGVRSLNTVDPDFQRTYNWEYHRRHPARAVPARVGVGHLVSPHSSTTCASPTTCCARRPTTSPIRRGQPARRRGVQHLHHQPGRAVALVDNFDTNAADGFEQTYNGFDITFNARLPRGGTLFGGFTTERTPRVVCGEPDDPNLLRFCDDARQRHPVAASR